MKDMVRRHPLAVSAIFLVLSPYLLALALLYAVAFVICVALDVILLARR